MRFPINPGRPSWDDGDAASLRAFLSGPIGQRFLAHLFYLRPEVAALEGEARRVQQDTHTGHENCIRDILTMAEPTPISEQDRAAQTNHLPEVP